MADDSDQALETHYDDARTRAQQEATHGRADAALRHSSRALTTVRELVRRHPDDRKHASVLAAALYNHGGHLSAAGRADEALAVLEEAHARYLALQRDDPVRHAVQRLDVLLRIGRTLAAAGRPTKALVPLRVAVAGYPTAPTADPAERAMCLVRAWAALGACLSALGDHDAALEAADQALFTAERTREEAGIDPRHTGWLAAAGPTYAQAAREWMAAAVYAVERHAAAGRWDIAADAANIAVRVCAGLAALGDAPLGEVYGLILDRAQQVWAVARGSAPGTEGAAAAGGPAMALVLAATGWRLPG